MKTHFREALDNIRATDDTPIKESTYDQMNMVNEVLDGVKQIVTEQVHDQVQKILPIIYPNHTYQEPPSQHPQMNFTQTFTPSNVSVAPSMANTTASNITTPTVQHYAYNVNAMQPPRVVQPTQPVHMPMPPAPMYNPVPPPPPPVAPLKGAQGFSNFGSSQSQHNRNRNKSKYIVQQIPPQFMQQQPSYPQYPRCQQQHMQRKYLNGQKDSGIFRKNTTLYCWSHGACSHNGYQCQQPKPGHIPWAIFNNRCGGCTDFYT